MKKLLAVLLTAAMMLTLFGVISVSAYDNPTIYIDKVEDASVGEEVSVWINFANNPGNICSLKLKIDFDPSLIQLQSIDNENATMNTEPFTSNFDENAYTAEQLKTLHPVTYVYQGFDNITDENGTIAELKFIPLEAALGQTVPVSISEISNITDVDLYDEKDITVSGSTPTISAVPNARYICGEVSSLSFTPCASGVCEVVFTSGSTPTSLTIPNTVKWSDDFDPTSIDASTTYEIPVLNGTMGVCAKWV